MKKLLIVILILGMASYASATILNINAQAEIAKELKRIRSNAARCKASMDSSITKMDSLKNSYASEVDATDGTNLQGILNNITTISTNAGTAVKDIDTDFPTIKE